MKLYKFLPLAALTAIALGGAMTSCDNDFDYPPVIIPEATMKANTTIEEVKTLYWNDARNYIDTIKLTDAGEHVIIAGRIIANDETGNVYKNLVIQDETAALTLSINQKNMYESYKLGQEVIIDLTDMFIGKYNGLQQMGYPQWYDAGDCWEATFMEYSLFQKHTQLNGLPDVSKIDTITTTLDELKNANDVAGQLRWQSQLIRLDNVHFADGGTTVFAPNGSSANRTLVDADGNTIIVRNSGYATFAGDMLPTGEGSVVAILSYYGTNWQLVLRSLSDCIGFDTPEPEDPNNPDQPDQPGTKANITISQLKDLYWQSDNNYAVTIGRNEDDEDYVIEATVISSDASGNVYKYLFIADETGAIAVSLDASNIYKTYAYGQKLLITASGLDIGKYAGLMCLGKSEPYGNGTEVGRMPLTSFQTHVRIVGQAQATNVVPVEATISEIAAIDRNNKDGLIKWQSQLVTLNNVHFQNGGTEAFVKNGTTTNQNLLDAEGKSLVVRTSNYASFKDDMLPAGNGTVTAILSYYNGTWQLLLNNADDCTGFSGAAKNRFKNFYK